MTNHIVLDFETRSACDLKKCGAARYAEDPTTQVLCLCWKVVETGEIGQWQPGDPRPDFGDAILVCHNASFEKSIWRSIMVPTFEWPDVPNSRWIDTTAVAAMKGLPQGLDMLTRTLRLDVEKDTAASRYVVALSKPSRKAALAGQWEVPDMERVVTYCHRDVEAQTAVFKRIGHLTPREHNVWLLDQRINERGFGIDIPLVRSMQAIVDKAIVPLAEEFNDLTGLKVTQVPKVVAWCAENGYAIENLQQATVAQALGHSPDLDDSDLDGGVPLPDAVRRALSIRQLIGSAAIKKLKAARDCVMADGRVRYSLQYHGASTGRWAGRLLQPHNFPRGTISADPDILVAAMRTEDPAYIDAVLGPPVETVVSSLRHMVVSRPDRLLVAGDFSQIEARIILALAGQWDKVELLRQSGSKTYCDAASQVYGYPVTKDMKAEYTLGKNIVLGCGFGMGCDKFHTKYAPNMSLDFCQDGIDTYRQDWAPLVPPVWYGLENAASKAVWDRRPCEAYGVVFGLDDAWLRARLPSGRTLWYYRPQPVQEYGRRSWTFQAKKMGQVRTVNAFGGLLAENLASGLARDLLVDAMFKCEKENLPIVLTVHDEIIAEPLTKDADPAMLGQIMEDIPPWAKALKVPVATECWASDRYRK